MATYMARRRGYSGLDDSSDGSEAGDLVIRELEELPWHSRPLVRTLLVVGAIAVVGAIILAIVLPLALKEEESNSSGGDGKRAFSLDDIFTTSVEGLSLTWWCPTTPLASASFIYQDKSGNIVKQGVDNSTQIFPDVSNQVVLFNKSAFIASNSAWNASLGAYYISPDGSHIVIAANQTMRWRHSFFANFFIFSVATQTAVALDEQHTRLMNPVWSPTSDNIAFVRDNNIYVRDLSSTTITQVTSDGTPNRQPDGTSIVNGVQSWVYEEEVFSEMSAIWWSPDGRHLAYFKFNETAVPQFFMPVYGGSAYPTIDNLAYPKPGFANPQVSIEVYSIANQSTTVLDWTDSGKYEYATGLWWINSDTVAVRRLNRLQNEEQTVLFNVVDGTSRVLFAKASSAWVETQFELTFLRETDGTIIYFADLVANSQSFPQVALYNFSTGALVRYLSDPTDSATWEVISINEWLPSTRTLIYTSAEVSPQERHIYAQNIDDTTGATKIKLSPSAGWWSGTFSTCSSFYTLNFGGNGDLLEVPTVHLRSFQDKELSVEMVNNQQLYKKMSELALPKKEFLRIPNAAGESMAASLLYPPNFDKNKKYPVLMRVYGGPNSQEISKSYPFGGQRSFDVLMASQGFIVGQADARGTAARGEKWRHIVYLNLGHYETADQLAAAKYFGALPFVDSARIGLWGWSYGGYMGGFVGSAPEAENVLKLTMSVAPVTDWRFYDSVYTERYMRTPELNPSGYSNSSVLNRVEGFKRLKYLLAHGTADDNVHLQNAAELSKVLVTGGIDFEQMYYTNSDHSINTGNARRHLYRLLSNFVVHNL